MRNIDIYHIFLWLSSWGIKVAVFALLFTSAATVFTGTWHLIEAGISLNRSLFELKYLAIEVLTIAEFYLLALLLFLTAFALQITVFGEMPHTERAPHLHRISVAMVKRMLLTTVVTIIVVYAAKTILNEGSTIDIGLLIGLIGGLILAVALYIFLLALAEKNSS